MLGRMVLAIVTIQPVGDEVYTTVKTGDKLLRKKYESIPDSPSTPSGLLQHTGYHRISPVRHYAARPAQSLTPSVPWEKRDSLTRVTYLC